MEQGRKRVVIENVYPEINCGEFPIKRTVGEKVVVEADIFVEGHDTPSGALLYRKEEESEWSEVPMLPLVNDRWRGAFPIRELGRYRYTIQGWVDPFLNWSRDLSKRVDAGQDVTVDLRIGANLIEAAAERATGLDADQLTLSASRLREGGERAIEQALSTDLARLMRRYADRTHATTYDKELGVMAERERARFCAWYEFFPRSCAGEPGQHGTFKECESRLPYVASMGFDIVYLPPVHPIGRSFRKGRNNRTVAEPGDVGSPWAIGAPEGGHKAIHPELGTLEDFRRLVEQAKSHGMEIAMDLAFQSAPDHPYVEEHPEWFRRRPDGTIQYAENPPKKYQDIYPFDFESAQWQELWEELKSVVLFWMDQGIRVFRVDNPHTKPFAFWHWLIDEIKRDYPEAIFLSEAFTRPKVMKRLAKVGFTQSYTYFTWRNTRAELIDYFMELTKTEMREYFRPNLWPNTPDILPEYLQVSGRPGFVARLVLAATLGAAYGVYGPAYELMEDRPIAPGKEEYLNSEKYEIRQWDLERPDSLRDLMARLNQIRRDNPALQSDWSLQFHPVDNDQLICYSKQTEDLDNIVVVLANLDPHHKQSGWVTLPLEELRIDPIRSYQMHDLLDDTRYLWNGPRNYVELDPQVASAHVFRVRRHLRTEHDFDYYM
ncbi:MAG: alpha-1,4-glucan--maltose-1-phosphate maltosyltransferase [Chloroflexota bacterium]|nr:alpha-1,4-glucan--maltose-1-phosphate maltosyltransferase [Chloroflexota bacterium]